MVEKDDKDHLSSPQEFRPYGKRWLVLTAVVLLNAAGAMIWLTFTPVAYKAVQYYNTDLNTINWLSIIFMVSGIPVGATATLILEKYGLKPALLISAWLACVGSGLRIISTIETLSDDASLATLFVGQILVAIGQPFCMFAPAKTASAWFPDNQRALATTIGAVANPIGVVIAGLVCPLFIVNGELDAFNLLITMFAPAAFAALFTTAVMTESAPSIPPSPGVKSGGVFGKGIKELFRNKNYMILLLTIGGGIGLYSTFATLLEQFLCPFGYTDQLAGICSAAMTASGVIGAAAAGIYVDITKQFSTVAKVCYGLTTLGIIIFCIVFHYYMDYYILILIIGIGLFSFGLYPLGVELGAECTYPVGVATSSGLIMMSGQFQSIVLVLVLGAIGRPMSVEETVKYGSTCLDFLSEDSPDSASHSTSAAFSEAVSSTASTPPSIYDLSVSLYICGGYMCFLALILIIFFRPNYRRMEAERVLQDEKVGVHGCRRDSDDSQSSTWKSSGIVSSL